MTRVADAVFMWSMDAYGGSIYTFADALDYGPFLCIIFFSISLVNMSK